MKECYVASRRASFIDLKDSQPNVGGEESRVTFC